MRYIRGVKYRHLMAYIQVEGRTKMEALRNAKKVGTFLKEELSEAQHFIPRPKGESEEGLFMYEVPVGIAECRKRAKPTLSRLMLKGSA